MSQIDYNLNEMVSWSIDVTPDYTLNNIEDSTDYVEATDFLVDYDYNYHYDFIPFNSQNPNNVNNTSINFIISEFHLSEESKNCCICMEDKKDTQFCNLNCLHNFCIECINSHLNTNHCCPLCRTYIYQIQTQTIEARQQIHH